MTAATDALLRERPPRVSRGIALGTARLLWMELQRNTMPWILPLIAVLFWFDSYRPSVGQPPIYVLHTFWNMGQGHTIVDFGPFVAGVAAWMGSRDGRRGTADLVTAAARPRWPAQLVTWAATAIWAVAAYLAFVGVLFAVYAYQGVQGTPPWWWVAVGAAAVAAFSAAGFALGALWPSRFAAALAAFGGFLAMMLSSQVGFTSPTGWAQVLPTNSNGNFQLPSGVFYPYLPDLPIARVMFLGGIAVAVLGLIGLPPASGGPRVRALAAAVTVAGLVAAGTGVALATTARLGAHGMVIPAVHDAADDRPLPYTPACGYSAGVPVCLNPAYRGFLGNVTSALAPVLHEITGLPGAPVKAVQQPGTYSSGEGGATESLTISGDPPVVHVPLDSLNLPGAFGGTNGDFARQLRLLFVHAFLGAGNGIGTPTQQALQAALLHDAGTPFNTERTDLTFLGLPSWALATGASQAVGTSSGNGPLSSSGAAVYAAAKRFAALPLGAQRAWLAAHLAALRAGQLIPAQLP